MVNIKVRSTNDNMHRHRHNWLTRSSLFDSPAGTAERLFEHSLRRRLTYVAVLLGLITALVGAGHLAAWLGGYLTQSGLTAITMKTNAALCLTLVGVALILLVSTEAGPTRRWTARAFAALALLMGFLTLVENLAGWNFGMDQLLAVEAPGAIDVVSPNRMGTPASSSFTLLGLALLLLSRRDHRGLRVAQALALAVCLIALLPTIGFLYGAERFYGIARYTAIAWPTAVSLLLLGLGLLCARPAEALMAQVTADDPGGVSLRRLLPVFVLLPLLLGWLRLVGERVGVFDAATGTGMMMLSFIIIFSTLAYHTSHRASRAANALCESEDRFRTMANAIPQLAWIARADGYIYWYNQRWYDYTGTTPAQMEGWGWQSVHHPQQLPGVLERWKSSIATGEPFDMIFPLRGADGIFRPFLTRVMPLKDDQGRVQQWFGTNTDVSEQKKAQEERERLLHEVSVHAAQLQEANEQLAAVNEELGASNEELRATTGELQDEIKNRREAEEVVRRSQKTFSELVERAPFGIYVVNSQFRIARMNAGSQTGAFRNVRPVIGRDFAEAMRILWPEPVAAEIIAVFRHTLETGEPYYSPRFTNPRHDVATVESYEWELHRMTLPDGQYGVICYYYDSTKLREAEAAVRESEERFRRYFELGLIGMAITSPTKGWIEVNDECCRLLGYERDELAQKTWAELTYPDDLAADVAQFDRVLAGQIDGYTIDKRFVRKNGQVVNTTISVTAMRGADGAVEYFIALLQDITQRKRAEEALVQARAEAELRASDLQTILDTGPVAIWIAHDPEARVITGNAYADQIVMNIVRGGNISRSARPGEAVISYRVFRNGVELKPEELPAQLAVLTGRPVFDQEMELRFEDGRSVQMIASAAPLFDAEGRVRGSVTTAADVTMLKKAQEALRELNATLENRVAQRTAELVYRARQLQKLALELSQAEEQERRRIALILHEDLQQQIAGAKFHLNLVRSRAKDDRQQRDVDTVDAMLKGAIDKSRSLSRDLSPAVLHMNDLAEVLQWLVNRMRAQQGLSVTLEVSGDMMLHSEALATFLFRAAQEMLFNVVRHAHVREAAIRARRIGRCVHLSVSDQGRGFDPQELKETPGVGLFSIRERAELLGGRMKVKSAKGEGSTFRITVPDGPPVVAPPPSGVNLPQPGAAGLPSAGALRVLLVDDHDVVRAGLAALLQEAPGIELVGEAPDGREAIDRAFDLRPDVVIMDVSMPVMSGDQATRQIKAHLPQTRVIALSMYDEAEKKERMFEAGAESYILKTVSAGELLAAIRGPSTPES